LHFQGERGNEIAATTTLLTCLGKIVEGETLYRLATTEVDFMNFRIEYVGAVERVECVLSQDEALFRKSKPSTNWGHLNLLR